MPLFSPHLGLPSSDFDVQDIARTARISPLHHQRFCERGVLSSENGCVDPIDRGGHKKILRDSAKNPTKSIKIRFIPENFAGQGVVRGCVSFQKISGVPVGFSFNKNLQIV